MQTILECPICYEGFSPSVRAVSLPCGHIFCEIDIGRIVDCDGDRSACPICRQEFHYGGRYNDVHKLFLQSVTNDVKPRSPTSAIAPDQRKEVDMLEKQMKAMSLETSPRDFRSAFADVRTWMSSLATIQDIDVKTALYRLNLTMDHLADRIVETTSLRDEVKRARAERDLVKKELQELRVVHASMTQDFMEEIERQERESKKLGALLHTATTTFKRQCSTDSMTQKLLGLNLSDQDQDNSCEADIHLDFLARAPSLLTTARHTRRAHARRSHNLDRQVEEDLCYRKGDLIKLISKSKGTWWLGSSNGEMGCVPDNCIAMLSAPMFSEVMYARAIKSYNGNKSTVEDLSFRKGDIIKIINKSEGTWRIGFLKGRVGYVPQAHVSSNLNQQK